ncbi:transposase [Cucumis melo var. makuwa]|uniref:Transposase n=1 Tax=Cucumis melo var. makuwa TaxID=1194695 RepID=A0A5D3BN69_CUCMM|nr:transposase [Cucumis melo var. makuwa]TYK00667.1 transposase [Cucumis melo var. makuwa]
MWPKFSYEPKNLRVALSADGINPYSDMSSNPKKSGDDIGIYLEPLIDDLKLLWESGVQCYDAYNEELFNLRTVMDD